MTLENHLPPETQSLIDRAHTEMTQENWHDAAETLAELYEKLSTFEVNYRLVTALFMDEQYQLASSYADDFLLNYLDDEANFRMVVALAIQNQNFVYAQQLAVLWDGVDTREAVIQEIRDAEKKAEITMAATFKTIARQFYHLSDTDIIEQRDRYESGRHLPVDQFIIGAKYILVDPYATPIIRATLLEDLQKLKLDEDIQYRWLDDELYTANFSQIPLLTNSKVFEQIADFLDEKLSQDDPIALDMLAQQVRFELTLIYPRIEEIVVDIENWVNATIDHYYGRQNNLELSSQKQWHDKVRNLTEDFFEK